MALLSSTDAARDGKANIDYMKDEIVDLSGEYLLMLNKPQDYICSTEKCATILELILPSFRQ